MSMFATTGNNIGIELAAILQFDGPLANSTRAVQGPSNTQSFARDVREICYILRSAHTTKWQKTVKHPKNCKIEGAGLLGTAQSRNWLEWS